MEYHYLILAVSLLILVLSFTMMQKKRENFRQTTTEVEPIIEAQVTIEAQPTLTPSLQVADVPVMACKPLPADYKEPSVQPVVQASPQPIVQVSTQPVVEPSPLPPLEIPLDEIVTEQTPTAFLRYMSKPNWAVKL